MEPVRAILFDFGHTLVDFLRTQEALHAAYEQIRDRVEAVAYMEVPELLDLVERVAGGVDRLVAESYEQHRMEEVDQAELFRQAFSGIGFDLPDDVLEHIVALDHSAYSNSITVEPEVLATLERLRESGYPMGLVSNISLRPDLMRADLERMGLGRYLDATVFSSEVGVRKPNLRIFQEALRRLGVEPGETVFVGDRLYDDVSGAQAAGMRGVLTRQFRREDDPDYAPDAVIDHLTQLPATLLELAHTR
ncbi:MAG TPA: HAD family hydrolase [Actinomycetota bacterium]|jgi:putative hydrolase of the HAD superfamily|nr:HAD family hydrolase [Actinomycetota bacterium]